MVNTPLVRSAIHSLCLLLALFVVTSCGTQKEQPESKAEQTNNGASGSESSSQDLSHAEDNKQTSFLSTSPHEEAGTLSPTGTSALPMLAYKVKVGDVFSYKVTQRNRVREGAIRSDDSTVYYYTKRITKVIPDSLVEFSVRFDKIAIRSTMPVPDSAGKPVNRTLQYNSANAADQKNPNFKRYTALIGQNVTMEVNPRGEILDITGLEPIANKLISSFKDSLTAEQKNFVMREIAVNAYAMIHKQEFQVYPDKPLDSTRSWKASYPAPLAGLFPTENTVTYTLENIATKNNRKVAQIRAKLYSKVLEKKRENELGSIVLNKGGLSGGSEHLVDLEKGYTIFKKYNLTINMEITATDSKTKQTQTTTQQTSSDITVELL